MRYTQIPTTTFQNIQLNAGIIVDSFTPATGVIGNILAATSGGVQFQDSVSFKDFGEDIDNCPKNTKELKLLESHEVKMSGTFTTVTVSAAKLMVGAADIDEQDETHIIPRNDLVLGDFREIWWVGDYSDVNSGDHAGFVAIKLINALSTGGFQIQSSDKDKGKFSFEFTGHYSIDDQDVVPYEIYIAEGSGGTTPSVYLNKHAVTIGVGDTVSLTAVTVPAAQTITWTSSATGKASVTSGGVVTGEQAGSAIITAKITVSGVDYTDTCTVVVTS